MNSVAIESLRLHPDSERVPLGSPSDLAALRSSLKENGQQDPIDVTPDGLILDGRTRWTLLRELGAQSVQVRELAIPDRDQTHYIVDRALARRHLTIEQKRQLNALLRNVVVEMTAHPKTGEEMRIGLSQPQRAAKLGVTTTTVQNWDQRDVTNNGAIPSSPTHIRRSGGNPTTYPVHPTEPKPRADPTPLRKARSIPYWSRQFSTWCRGARPEDRKFLERIDRELHAALVRNDIPCEKEKAS